MVRRLKRWRVPVPAAPEEKALKVELKDTSLTDALFGGTSTLPGDAFVMFVLLCFLLASGPLLRAQHAGGQRGDAAVLAVPILSVPV